MALVATFAVLLLVAPDTRISAYPSAGRDVSEFRVTENVVGTVDFFDAQAIHRLELSWDEGDYQRALDDFRDDGTKRWIRADAIIDGTRVPNVGMRLKGSTALTPDPLGPEVTDPQRLPWLLSFDEFSDGRRYQNHREIALRVPGGTLAPVTGLHETLSLAINRLAGEPTQHTTYLTMSVNGQPPSVRLAVQNPGQSWVDGAVSAATGDADGVLYKALRTGRFEFCGADPLVYSDSFDQVTRRRLADLAPLIGLLRWESQADDETFAAELPNYLEVESFARYLAVHHAILDTDDMSGPGQNYYLWYSNRSQKFTVLTWDTDLTFARDPNLGPLEPVRASNADGPADQPPTTAGSGEAGGSSADPPRCGTATGEVGHPLKTRFLNAPAFRDLYLSAYRTLVNDVLASGAAAAELNRWEALLRTMDATVVDPLVVETEAARVRLALTARVAALAGLSELATN